MTKHLRRTIAAVVLLAAPLGAQDFLALVDGRYVLGPPMTRTPEGIVVRFENGRVLVPAAMIASSVVSANEGVEPQRWSAEERKRISLGQVPYQGQWVSKRTLRGRQKLTHDRAGQQRNYARDQLRWANRHRKTTKHFRLEYNITDERMAHYASYMERFFAFVRKELKVTVPSIGKLKVSVFDDYRLYNQVMGPRSDSFYDDRGAELNFYDEPMSRERTLRRMREGLTRYVLFLVNPKFRHPEWVRESLARYYGASRWDAKAKTFSAGHLEIDLMTRVLDDRLAGHPQQVRDIIRNNRIFGPSQGPWGWSFVHFLMRGGYEARFRKYVKDLARSSAIRRDGWFGKHSEVVPDELERTLPRYLGLKSLARVEEEWYAHILTYAEPASVGELAEAGRLALHRGMPQTAEGFLEKAIAGGAKDTETVALSGMALYRNGKVNEARQRFERAIGDDPLSGKLYYWLALTVPEREEREAEVRRLVLLALEITPGDKEVQYAARQLLGKGETVVKK